MRHRSWALIPALIAAAPSSASYAPQHRVTAKVHVEVTNLRNHKGVVLACMTKDPKGFPDCDGDELSFRSSIPAGEALVLEFDAIPPGTYAISVLHDENDNGRVDRALFLIPREGFGFSRDAPVRMGPPDFEDAAFEVGASDVSQTIRMRYML